MSKAEKKIAVLDTGLSLSKADIASLKPKLLREHLKRTLNVLNDDWKIYLIVEALAHQFSCDMRSVTHGVRVTKGCADSSDYSFSKGGYTDKATKKLAKFFYTHEDALRSYVASLDLVIGAEGKGKRPLILSMAYGAEFVNAEEDGVDSDTQEDYLRVMNRKESVFVTESGRECAALLGGDDLNSESLGVQLLKRVASKYGLVVCTSDTEVLFDKEEGEITMVSFAVLEY